MEPELGTALVSEGLLSPTRGSKWSFTYTSVTHGGDNKNPLGVLNSIPLASGDSSSGNLGHYCAEIVTLGLRMLGTSGGLPGCVPII